MGSLKSAELAAMAESSCKKPPPRRWQQGFTPWCHLQRAWPAADPGFALRVTPVGFARPGVDSAKAPCLLCGGAVARNERRRPQL